MSTGPEERMWSRPSPKLSPGQLHMFYEDKLFFNGLLKVTKRVKFNNCNYSILRELISRVFSCNLKIFWDIISHNCPGTL